MTNRIKSSLAVGLVVLAVATLAQMAMAQDGQMRRRGPGPGLGGPPHGGPRPMGPMGPGRMGPMGGGPMVPLGALDLTESQRGQVKAIMDSHKDEFRAAGEKVGVARQALRGLLEADPIDEPAIRAKSVDVAAAEGDAAILRAKVRTEIYAILTPEQVQKAKELRPKRRGR